MDEAKTKDFKSSLPPLNSAQTTQFISSFDTPMEDTTDRSNPNNGNINQTYEFNDTDVPSRDFNNDIIINSDDEMMMHELLGQSVDPMDHSANDNTNSNDISMKTTESVNDKNVQIQQSAPSQTIVVMPECDKSSMSNALEINVNVKNSSASKNHSSRNDINGMDAENMPPPKDSSPIQNANPSVIFMFNDEVIPIDQVKSKLITEAYHIDTNHHTTTINITPQLTIDSSQITLTKLTNIQRRNGSNEHKQNTFNYNLIANLHRPSKKAKLYPDKIDIVSHYPSRKLSFFELQISKQVERIVKSIEAAQNRTGKQSVYKISSPGALLISGDTDIRSIPDKLIGEIIKSINSKPTQSDYDHYKPLKVAVVYSFTGKGASAMAQSMQNISYAINSIDHDEYYVRSIISPDHGDIQRTESGFDYFPYDTNKTAFEILNVYEWKKGDRIPNIFQYKKLNVNLEIKGENFIFPQCTLAFIAKKGAQYAFTDRIFDILTDIKHQSNNCIANIFYFYVAYVRHMRQIFEGSIDYSPIAIYFKLPITNDNDWIFTFNTEKLTQKIVNDTIKYDARMLTAMQTNNLSDFVGTPPFDVDDTIYNNFKQYFVKTGNIQAASVFQQDLNANTNDHIIIVRFYDFNRLFLEGVPVDKIHEKWSNLILLFSNNTITLSNGINTIIRYPFWNLYYTILQHLPKCIEEQTLLQHFTKECDIYNRKVKAQELRVAALYKTSDASFVQSKLKTEGYNLCRKCGTNHNWKFTSCPKTRLRTPHPIDNSKCDLYSEKSVYSKTMVNNVHIIIIARLMGWDLSNLTAEIYMNYHNSVKYVSALGMARLNILHEYNALVECDNPIGWKIDLTKLRNFMKLAANHSHCSQFINEQINYRFNVRNSNNNNSSFITAHALLKNNNNKDIYDEEDGKSDEKTDDM